MRTPTMLIGVLMLWASTALAGPVADFEKSLRVAYADYRAALFLTNSGKLPESAKVMAAFKGKWDGIEKTWGAAPPPQYADDPKWKETLDNVSATLVKASSEIDGGALPAAHATLEAIREAISDLHERNGIISFSDRMNDYHAVMEQVLGQDLTKPDAMAMTEVLEMAAVLKYLAGDALAHPPAEAAGSSEFEDLAKAVSASVDAVVTAARAGDAEKLKVAIAKLKPSYARFFVKFG